jgi:hypothetical protein
MKRLAMLAVFAACSAKPSTTLSHPLYWSIAKGGKTTYLLGTMHVGVDARTRLPKEIWHQLEVAPVFAMETDETDPAMKEMGQRLDAGSLHADLGDAYWQKLQAELTPAVAENVDHARPLVAAVLLSLKGMPETEAMDGVLVAEAKHEHKDIVYLEPARKQLDLLQKWLDVRAIKALLDHPSAPHDKDMLGAYLAGDETAMLALANQERETARAAGYTDAEYDQEMADFLYERNASWIDAIEQIHTRGGGFIAVGALHLLGQKSVLDLLAHRGYVVTRVEP